MQQLLMLNPRRRRAYKRRSPRRHRVRSFIERRMGRTVRVRGHYSNPRRRRRYARAHRENPRRRRRHAFGAYRTRRYSNPRRYRRMANPRTEGKGSIVHDLGAAGVGIAAAVGLKLVWGYGASYLPTTLQSGYGALGTQAAVVLAAGWGLDKWMPRHRRTITYGVVGALTVIGYSLALQLLQTYAPNLAGLQDYHEYTLGAYIPGSGSMVPGAMPPVVLPHAGTRPTVGMVSAGAPLRRGVGAYQRAYSY